MSNTGTDHLEGSGASGDGREAANRKLLTICDLTAQVLATIAAILFSVSFVLRDSILIDLGFMAMGTLSIFGAAAMIDKHLDIEKISDKERSFLGLVLFSVVVSSMPSLAACAHYLEYSCLYGKTVFASTFGTIAGLAMILSAPLLLYKKMMTQEFPCRFGLWFGASLALSLAVLLFRLGASLLSPNWSEIAGACRSASG